MARADNADRGYVLLKPPEKDGSPNWLQLNEVLRTIQDRIWAVEGRTSPTTLRNSATVLAPPRDPDVAPEDSFRLYYDVAAGYAKVSESGSEFRKAFQEPGDVIADGDKGDITVSGSGANWQIDPSAVGTAEIADDAVTFAKLQDSSALDVLLGARGSVVGVGPYGEVTLGASMSLAAGPSLRRAALTGDVTAPVNSNTTTIANDAVTYAKMQDVSAASRLLGRGSAAGSGNPEEITLGTGLSMSGTTLSVPTAPTQVHLTADQTFSSATLASVTGMSFSVTSGVYYLFEFTILYQSDTLAVGLALAVTTPTFTRMGYTVRSMIADDGPAAESQGAGTSSGDNVSGAAVPATNTDYVAVVSGVILPSANGTLQLQAATSVGVTSVIVRQGSVGELTTFV